MEIFHITFFIKIDFLHGSECHMLSVTFTRLCPSTGEGGCVILFLLCVHVLLVDYVCSIEGVRTIRLVIHN